MDSGLGVAQGIGLILMVILTASTLGMDYGWGTLRAVLANGAGRWQYLSVKLLLMALVAGGALVVVTAATALSSLLAGALASDGAGNVEDPMGWADVGTSFAKTWFALLPYVAVAVFITVVTSSSAGGMAVALGYYFAELIAVAIMINLFDWFQNVADYVLGRNITGWMLGVQRESVSGGVVGDIGLEEFPGDLHAFLVMAGYTLVLGALAFWIFQRRDVVATGGG